MRPFISSISLLIVACVCAMIMPTMTMAMFEEQAGLTDWHVTHIGSVTSLLPLSTPPSLIVTTSENVLASISVSNSNSVASGDLRWRQLLPEGESILSLTRYSSVRVATLSSGPVGEDALVRMWSTKNGAMLWDANIANDASSPSSSSSDANALVYADVETIADVNGDNKADVVALLKGTVTLLNGADGSAVWSWSKSGFSGFLLVIEGGRIGVVGTDSSNAIIVYVLNAKDGVESSSRSIPFAGSVVSKHNVLFLAPSSIAVLDAASKIATVYRVLLSASSDNMPLTAVLPSPSPIEHMEHIGGDDATSYLVVYGGLQQLVLEFNNVANSFRVVNTFASAPGADVEYTLSLDPATKVQEVVRAILTKGKLQVESFALASPTTSPLATLVKSTPFTNRGGLKHMWVDRSAPSASKKPPSVPSGTLEPRIIILGVDSSLSLFQANALIWTREEALASVDSMQFVELPVASGGSGASEKDDGSYPPFLARLWPQALSVAQGVLGIVDASNGLTQLTEALKNANNTVRAMMDRAAGIASVSSSRSVASATSFARPLSSASAGSAGSAEAPGSLRQDYFGFRKIMLATTASGKVYALDSASGAIVWSKFIRPSAGAGADADEQANELDEAASPVWRVHVLSHHEAVAIVHDEPSADVRRSHLVAFNPLTGEIIPASSLRLDFLVQTSLLLPYVDSHNRHVLLVASAAGRNLEVFPATREVRTIVADNAANIFFYTIDLEQVLRGFALRASTLGSEPSSKEFSATQTWLVRFPLGIEKIVSVAARPAGEVVQSGVRVLGGGDGGYLYKYINTNLLAVATVRSTSSSAQRVVPALKRTTDPSVNLYLLDTITGTIVDKFVHRSCEGPVTVLQSENSIIYHYYNNAELHYELSVVELYETRDGDNTAGAGVVPIAGSIFDGLSLSSVSRLALGAQPSKPFDSFVDGPPSSISQTFTFPSRVRFLAATQTRRGITTKELLVGLPSDQLYSVPRVLIDPRRPVGEPTLLDRMDGLVPYTSAIPIDPMRMITHTRTIGHIRGVHASTALLESTSIVCAWGVDVFCSRVNPAQTFDLLNEDFNSPFLIATVSAVFIAIIFTRRMAKAKDLKTAWK